MWDFAVIGKGLIGSAAIKYLSQNTKLKSCIIGPDEPENYATWNGPYSSHFDEARITRVSYPDKLWSILAKQSIDQYSLIEKSSGIKFHFPNGHLRVGSEEIVANVAKVSEATDTKYKLLNAEQLAKLFPEFSFKNSVGLLEFAPAGHINPRRLKAAQLQMAKLNGATEINHSVKSLEEGRESIKLLLSSGSVIEANQVLICTGAYTRFLNLPWKSEEFKAIYETVCLGEVGTTEKSLASLPSLIYHPTGSAKEYFYMLPACTYPNGRMYMKIGSDNDGIGPTSLNDISEWFKSDGNQTTFKNLKKELMAFCPEVRFSKFESKPCILTYTLSGKPAINQMSSSKIFVATGGNGGAAKSSDAIGRIGAGIMLGEDWGYGLDLSQFKL